MGPTTLPDFNPSGDHRVDTIKGCTEKLLQICDALRADPTVDGRCLALAMTNYEQAAMWAVKALFVGRKPTGEV
jgi:hypothetical protein